MKLIWFAGICAIVMVLCASPVSAQMVVSAKSGVLNYTDGEVFLNDQAVEATVTHYPDVKEGNVLRTEEGRAELLLTPGTILRLGPHASLKMIANRLIDTRLELLSGSAVVEADEIAKDTSVLVVLKYAAVGLPKAGIYRFDTEPLQVKVFKGEAAVAVDGQTTLVGAGKMAVLSGGQAAVEKFNPEDTDALDRWSHRRGELMAMANPSTAKSLLNSGAYPVAYGNTPCGSYWGYNSYFGTMTLVPCTGFIFSPYGYRFWSPVTVTRVFYRPPIFYGGPYGGSYGGYSSYSSSVSTSTGYSGTLSSAPSFSGSSTGGASAATASSAGAASAGHGGAAAGGASGGSHGGR